jgi:hypothetical protein
VVRQNTQFNGNIVIGHLEVEQTGTRLMVWHIGLPLVLNLGWAALILVALPRFFGLPFGDAVFLLGDYAVVLAASAVVALIWGVLRTVLVWRSAFEVTNWTSRRVHIQER